MSLQEFLNSDSVNNLTDEVAISDRFKGEEGKLLKFTIKAMTSSEFKALRKAALKLKKRDASILIVPFLTERSSLIIPSIRTLKVLRLFKR